MPSPDVSNYVDLTVFDLQPTTIYDSAVQYAQVALPEWTPVPGSVEDALLQAAADMTGQLVGAINRLPAGVIEGLLALFGVTRNSGTQPTGTATLTFVDDSGYTLSAGTRFGYLDTGGNEPTLYIFQTSEAVSVPAGSTTADVDIEGIALVTYPSLASGTELQLLTAVSYIDSIVLNGDLEPGGDAETDEEYLNRGASVFGTLSEALVLPKQFERYVLTNFSSAYRVKSHSRVKVEENPSVLARSGNVVTATIESGHGIVAGDPIRIYGSEITGASTNFDGVFTVSNVTSTTVQWSQTGSNATASTTGKLISHKLQDLAQNGYLTIYVAGVDGASLTAESLVGIEEALTEKAIAGLTIVVNNAVVTPVDVNVEVTLKTGYSAAQVSSLIQAAMDTYLDPDYWQWESAVYYNELISLVDRVEGVDRVVSLSVSGVANWTSLSGDDLVFDYFGVLPIHTTTVTVSS